MGAGVSYQKNVNTVAIQGLQGLQPPATLSQNQNLNYQGTIQFTNKASGSTQPFTLGNFGNLVPDIRYLTLILFNATTQAINAASLTLTIELAGLTQTMTFPFYGDQSGNTIISIAANTVQTLLFPLPYALPIGTFTLNVSLAASGYGQVGYSLTLSGQGKGSRFLPGSLELDTGGGSILSFPGAGLSWYIKSIKATNSSSTSSEIQIGWYPKAPPGTGQSFVPVGYIDQAYIAANGGGYVQEFENYYALPTNNGLSANIVDISTTMLVVVEYLIAP